MLKTIASFFTSNITYILIGIILVLCVGVVGMYSFSQHKDKQIATLSLQLDAQQKQNEVLSASLSDVKSMRDAENKALQETRKQLKSLQETRDETTKGVENVYKNKNVDNPPLDGDIIRMLNEVCKSVRPTGCPNP